MDGDGCMSCHRVSIIGNFQFITVVQQILVREADLNYTKLFKHKGENCYSLTYGGNGNTKKIHNYMYRDATVFLKRKKDKF